MSEHLLNKKFLPLLSSHFLSAVNDAFVRTLFTFFVVYQMAASMAAVVIPAVIFYALAFCVGSTFAGGWADKISKKSFLLQARLAEIVVALTSVVAAKYESMVLFVLIAGVMGCLAACIRVGNYALMPSLISESKLQLYFNSGSAMLCPEPVIGVPLNCGTG